MKFNCPHCQYLLKVPDNAAGRKGTCPKCGHKVMVPEPASAPQRPTIRPTAPVNSSARQSSASSSSSPHTQTGKKQSGGFQACCLLVVILFVVLLVIGWFVGVGDLEQQSETAKYESGDDDEWEDYYGGDSTENYGLVKETLRGIRLRDGTILLRDGRIYNPSTGKVKRQRYR